MDEKAPLPETVAPGIPPPPVIANASATSSAHRPASVTVIALLMMVISFYYVFYFATYFYRLLPYPQVVPPGYAWVIVLSLIVFVAAIGMFISAIALFRRREWARRGMIAFSLLLTVCMMVMMCSLWALRQISLTVSAGIYAIIITLLIGCVPAIFLNRRVAKDYFGSSRDLTS